MEIDTCLLCDAATVREGLLHVLGGGITQTARTEFPSPLGMSLAMRILVHPTEATSAHDILVVLNDEDGEEVTRFQVRTGAVDDADEVPAGQKPEIMFAWDFPGRPSLPHPGKYSFEILIDGIHQRSVPFEAVMSGDAR